ncbi:MAG TPA: FAD-dependent oxidoreductase [Blastocatellia bacterium]|nr:FAD-dependent oxidoreductase [Blastocatellia bacterium]
MTRLTRREAFRAVSLLAGGVAFNSACARRVRPYVIDPPPGSSKRLRHFTPVNVAPERVIRTVVGLRPFRPSGFVVRAESLGDKLLVHNYGHGGGGVTLSWGTAHLAAELVRESGKTGAAAVIGCGVIGLATARTLQRRGFDVTIYAKDMPPETTSNIAGASWSPTSVVDEDNRTPAWDSQFERAARFAHRSFQLLVGDEYAVRWREQYNLSDVDYPDSWDHELLRDLFPNHRSLKPSEHPFPARFVKVDSMMFIEPSIYLNTLLRDFYIAGGRIRRVTFATPAQLATLIEPIIVNCTGLGARELFGDRELMPIKGQLHVLIPQPEVDYAMVGMGLYMFPRRDGIILGGTFERGVETMEPNREAEQRIIAGHKRIFEGMR